MIFKIKSTWKMLFRLFFSIIVVAFVCSQIAFNELLSYVKQINVGYYLFAIILLVGASLIAAYKWSKIMTRIGYTSHFNFYAKVYLVGCLFNQVLPTSVGGDAVRIAYLQKLGVGLRAGFYGVFADRYYGVIGLILLNAASLFWIQDKIPSSLFTLLYLMLFILGSGLVFALLPSQLHFLAKIKLLGGLYQLSKTLLVSLGSFSQTLVLLFLAILTNFITIYSIYMIALSLHLSINLIELLGIMPAITIITLLPISFAGWGLREGAMVGFLLFLGLAKAAILALSLLYGVALIIASLPGLYIYLFNRIK